MKKNAFVGAALLCVMNVGAWAQSGAQGYATLIFPYEVTVDRTVLPAGEYMFHRLNATNNVVTIYNVRQSKPVGTFVAIGPVETEASPRAEAVLKRVGDRYYMEELRLSGQVGLQLHVAAEDR